MNGNSNIMILRTLKFLLDEVSCLSEDLSTTEYLDGVRRQLLIEQGKSFVVIEHGKSKAFGCIECNSEFFDAFDKFQKKRMKSYFNRKDDHAVIVDVYDEFYNEWYNLNYCEPSIFNTFTPEENIKAMATTTFENLVSYFVNDHE